MAALCSQEKVKLQAYKGERSKSTSSPPATAMKHLKRKRCFAVNLRFGKKKHCKSWFLSFLVMTGKEPSLDGSPSPLPSADKLRFLPVTPPLPPLPGRLRIRSACVCGAGRKSDYTILFQGLFIMVIYCSRFVTYCLPCRRSRSKKLCFSVLEVNERLFLSIW